MNWMTNLPESAKNKPLVNLAIPGSHDSCAWYLNQNLPLAPGQPAMFQYFKRIVYNWSLAQKLNLQEQLSIGIRYFDIRVAPLPESGEFRIIHGLYGHTLESQLSEIKDFLVQNPKEIVLIDFQHCLGCSEQQHNQIINLITKMFKDRLVSCVNREIKSLTINELNSNQKQVIAIYHHKNDSNFMWPGNIIASPWHNLQDCEKVLHCLARDLPKRPENKLFVSQAVMTPIANTIIFSANETLISWQRSLFRKLPHWLKNHIYCNNSNIVICDCVDKTYADIVIQSNYM